MAIEWLLIMFLLGGQTFSAVQRWGWVGALGYGLLMAASFICLMGFLVMIGALH